MGIVGPGQVQRRLRRPEQWGATSAAITTTKTETEKTIIEKKVGFSHINVRILKASFPDGPRVLSF